MNEKPEKPESLYDVADHLADLLGIYEDARCDWGVITGEEDQRWEGDNGHVDDCNCRVQWVPRLVDRILTTEEYVTLAAALVRVQERQEQPVVRDRAFRPDFREIVRPARRIGQPPTPPSGGFIGDIFLKP